MRLKTIFIAGGLVPCGHRKMEQCGPAVRYIRACHGSFLLVFHLSSIQADNLESFIVYYA